MSQNFKPPVRLCKVLRDWLGGRVKTDLIGESRKAKVWVHQQLTFGRKQELWRERGLQTLQVTVSHLFHQRNRIKPMECSAAIQFLIKPIWQRPQNETTSQNQGFCFSRQMRISVCQSPMLLDTFQWASTDQSQPWERPKEICSRTILSGLSPCTFHEEGHSCVYVIRKGNVLNSKTYYYHVTCGDVPYFRKSLNSINLFHRTELPPTHPALR